MRLPPLHVKDTTTLTDSINEAWSAYCAKTLKNEKQIKIPTKMWYCVGIVSMKGQYYKPREDRQVEE